MAHIYYYESGGSKVPGTEIFFRVMAGDDVEEPISMTAKLHAVSRMSESRTADGGSATFHPEVS